MPDAVSLFRKGSLIPDVLSFETDLIERVDTARVEAAKTVAQAREKAEQLISDTKRQLPRIADERRSKLIASTENDTSALEHDHTEILSELTAAIERNSAKALDAILDRIIPESVDRSRS